MPVRKRFRVEEVGHETVSMSEMVDAGPMPYHNEIMSELRAIRAQMASPHGEASESPVQVETDGIQVKSENMHATLEAYRAQIEQCEKLKVELDLIHEAINRTKREIAVLHGKSFSGDEMTKVTGELGAVVGGTEEATQQILEAAEAIDEAASAMGKTQSADQQARLSQDIQERVITIFEACNFQDLTGQRIGKVTRTLSFIEERVNAMLLLWNSKELEALPMSPSLDKVDNGLELHGPAGGAQPASISQNDIDALFD
jgi:chemotaxis protein CheZ